MESPVEKSVDSAEATALVFELHQLKEKIKELKEAAATIEETLITEHPGFRVQVAEDVVYYYGTKKKDEIFNEKIFDFFSIVPDFRALLSKNCFKIGELKFLAEKMEDCKDFYQQIETGEVKVGTLNPQFQKVKKSA